MMKRHMDREAERLKKHILTLSAMAEERVRESVQALINRDVALATQVVDSDNEIDLMEVDIEEECLKILALYQPVASDLRFVVAVLKINNDLERVADLAVNIAERAVFLAQHEPLDIPLNFDLMSEKSQAMLRKSLDALMTMNVSLAYQVGSDDDEVDELNRQMFVRIQEAMREHPDRIEPLGHLLSVSRHLERIADYATNIAEDVVYMIEGEIIRHRTETFR
ncbi:MAG: phosphate signaling complex protein PhoU [Armatimonadota bacterium]